MNLLYLVSKLQWWFSGSVYIALSYRVSLSKDMNPLQEDTPSLFIGVGIINAKSFIINMKLPYFGVLIPN